MKEVGKYCISFGKYCISLIPLLLCGTTSLYIATAFSLAQTDELQNRLAICFLVYFIGLLFAYLKKISEKKISTENHNSSITFIISFLSFIVTATLAVTLANIMDLGALPPLAIALIGLVFAIIPFIIFNKIQGKGTWKKLTFIFIEIGVEYIILPLVIAGFVFYKLGEAGEAYFYGMAFFTVFFIIILGVLVSTIDILSYSCFDGVVTIIRKLF